MASLFERLESRLSQRNENGLFLGNRHRAGRLAFDFPDVFSFRVDHFAFAAFLEIAVLECEGRGVPEGLGRRLCPSLQADHNV